MVRIKCRLGYAELHKPAPGFGPGEAEVSFLRCFTISSYSVNNVNNSKTVNNDNMGPELEL